MTLSPDIQDDDAATAPSIHARLSAAFHGKKRALGALQRACGASSIEAADIVAIASLGLADDLEVLVAVGAPWAAWHTGRAEPHSGKTGTSIGRAMRQLGSAGTGFGPRDPGAVRALSRVVEASTASQLAVELTAVARLLRSTDWPPHWGTLYDDVHDWLDPQVRSAVRLRWAQDFYTVTPKQPK